MIDRRLVVVWLGLVAATAVSWAAAGAVVALALAMVKVRYVALEFMELRDAPPVLRWGVEIWVGVVGVTLVALYLG